MQLVHRCFAVVAIASVVVAWSAPAQSAEPQGGSCADRAAGRAVQSLRSRVEEERLYSSWAKAGCLAYQAERCDSKKVDVAIREVHSSQCGGDPATSPVVDRFRVYRNSKKIEWYNVAKGEYLEFSKVHSVGGR